MCLPIPSSPAGREGRSSEQRLGLRSLLKRQSRVIRAHLVLSLNHSEFVLYTIEPTKRDIDVR